MAVGGATKKSNRSKGGGLSRKKRPLKDPRGGLTAAGRAWFKEKEGARLLEKYEASKGKKARAVKYV